MSFVGVNTPHNRYHNHFYSSNMYDLDNLQWRDYGGDYGGVVQINLRKKWGDPRVYMRSNWGDPHVICHHVISSVYLS